MDVSAQVTVSAGVVPEAHLPARTRTAASVRSTLPAGVADAPSIPLTLIARDIAHLPAAVRYAPAVPPRDATAPQPVDLSA